MLLLVGQSVLFLLSGNRLLEVLLGRRYPLVSLLLLVTILRLESNSFKHLLVFNFVHLLNVVLVVIRGLGTFELLFIRRALSLRSLLQQHSRQ